MNLIIGNEMLDIKDITNTIIQGDCIETMRTFPAKSINCCVTSPPYWGLRDYGVDGQLGLEDTPEEFVSKMVAVFAEVKRVLRDDGTLWLNLGDSYAHNTKGDTRTKEDYIRQGATVGALLSGAQNAGGVRKCNHGVKVKDLVGIPWMVAFALRKDGWYLRQDIIWHKPNPMPESVKDRCTKAHEYIFLLSKNKKYYYDADAIREDFTDDRMGNPKGGGQYAKEAFKDVFGPNAQSGLQKGEWNADGSVTGRNKRSVWTVTTKPYSEAHFATFPPDLIEPCILAGCPADGIVLDPFMGSGTTAMVAYENNRNYVGCELNPEYIELNRADIAKEKYGLFE
jgi:DNA modification methylase